MPTWFWLLLIGWAICVMPLACLVGHIAHNPESDDEEMLDHMVG